MKLARGVVTNTGIRFHSKAVVLSAGTFLNGLVHIGLEHFTAGRIGDPAVCGWGTIEGVRGFLKVV